MNGDDILDRVRKVVAVVRWPLNCGILWIIINVHERSCIVLWR